jgi:dihydrofolate reductase
MRKVILDLTLSLDGFIEGPNKEIDWIVFDQETMVYLNAFAHEIDTVFYGRISYEEYGNYQPPSASSKEEQQFYESVHQMTKYVFSRSMPASPEGATLIADDIEAQVLEIKNQHGKDIWLFGGADLITTFVNLNLIDEYRLSIQPVILGGGNPLFKNIQSRLPLKLLKTKTSDSGVVALYYEPALKA